MSGCHNPAIHNRNHSFNVNIELSGDDLNINLSAKIFNFLEVKADDDALKRLGKEIQEALQRAIAKE
jgi:hypothetical protein